MEDSKIIELYWERSEDAVKETQSKYNSYLKAIAMNVLHNKEDCEECLNDTYLTAWSKIPPEKPRSLSAYLGKITKCISINLYHKNKAKKRYSELTVLLSELEECIPDLPDKTPPSTDSDITIAINTWLRSLDTEKRVLFVRRYWLNQSLNSLAKEFGMSQSKLASMMLRLRSSLREFLRKENIIV